MANSFFEKLKHGLSKTRGGLIGSIFSGADRINDNFYDELEEALILADVGGETTADLISKLRGHVRENKLYLAEEAKPVLRELIAVAMTADEADYTSDRVILLVGVNGVGKTTCAGKLANHYAGMGKRVTLAAADTFRAAAAEQLEIWAERANAPLIRHSDGSDPAAVVFDAIASYKAKGGGVLICDTAGRLHNNKNLMNELAKMRRVIARELADTPCEVLLVLDATTGQNALHQAEIFSREAGVTGIIITKLDGTAKGGVAIAVKQMLGVPIRFIGVGEGIDDLQPFDPAAYAEAFI